MGTPAEAPKLRDTGSSLLTRREVLRRAAIATAGLVAAPAVLAACSAGTATQTPTAAPPTPSPSLPPGSLVPSASPGPASVLRVGPIFGVFGADWGADAMAGLTEVNARFAAEVSPVTLVVDPSQPPGFDAAGYFARQPADVAAYQESVSMRYFAEKAGTLAPIDDVWDRVKDNYPAALTDVVRGADGHVYGLPFEAHGSVFFYRKSLFAEKGYTPPATWKDFLGLCARMQSDKLPPIALGDLDAWPLVDVFDMFDLRLNGYAFHRGLLAGSEKWTDARVVKVFETWRKLVPYYPPDFATTKWQDAFKKVTQKQAGMCFVGSFALPDSRSLDPAILDDLDCFEFPMFGNEWDAERAILAATECWVLPTRSATRTANLTAAKRYLEFWARGSTQLIENSHLRGYVPLARDTDRSQLRGVDRRLFDLIASAGRITQESLREMRGDFVSGLWSYLLDFARTPTRDLKTMLASLQQYGNDLPQPYTEDPALTPEPS